jgi:multidrug resistance efflux pump
MRNVLEVLEAGPSDSLLLGLAWLAGQQVERDADELKGTLRRAELLLATGGDPRRELDLDDRAVSAVAADLGTEQAREQLEDALARLTADSEGLAAVSDGLARLRSQPDLAWQCYAYALLADAIASG